MVTRDFAPYCGQTGWMVRAVSMANYLAENGFDVIVVAASRSARWDALNVHHDVNVQWIVDPFQYFKYDHRSWLRRTVNAVGYIVTKLLGILRVSIFDRNMITLAPYKTKIRKLAVERPIDSVIVTTPPHSLQVLVPWLKTIIPGATLISDFRDGWSISPMYSGSERLKERIRAEERKIFEEVDCVVFVSEGMREIYCEEFDIRRTCVIENGYTGSAVVDPTQDLADVTMSYREEGRIVLGYFGSGAIGHEGQDKDLTVLFRAIEADEGLLARFALVIQGRLAMNPKFRSKVAYKKFEPVEYAVVMANMRKVDVGVNLFDFDKEYAPCVVAGKTYEYIYNSLPILAIVPSTARSVKKIVGETGGYYANVEDSGSIRKVLWRIATDFADGKNRGGCLDEDTRARYSRESQYKKILEVMRPSEPSKECLLD